MGGGWAAGVPWLGRVCGAKQAPKKKVKLNEDGEPEPPTWFKKNEPVRAKLGLGPEDKPWTGRDDVHLHGLRSQAEVPNFSHDQIDLTYTQYRIKQQRPVWECDRSELKYLVADIREGSGHARSDGNATMKCRSLLYYHMHDRVLCGRDCFLLQGWGHDVDLSTLAEPFDDNLQDAYDRYRGKTPDVDVPSKKRRARTFTKDLNRVQHKACGNAMCLPDIGLVQYCSLLAMENPSLWQNPPLDEMITIQNDIGTLVIDHKDPISLNRFTATLQCQLDCEMEKAMESDGAEESD